MGYLLLLNYPLFSVPSCVPQGHLTLDSSPSIGQMIATQIQCSITLHLLKEVLMEKIGFTEQEFPPSKHTNVSTILSSKIWS